MTTTQNDGGVRHLKWLIESRADNQRAALQLYEALTKHPDSERNRTAQTIIAIGFSLWRAAFLADRTGRSSERSEPAASVLLRMLADNAIGYAQDRESREWTFNYY